MMRARNTAVVVGALGVIGRYIVDALSATRDWRVVGLSRRKGTAREGVEYISVDLLDASQAADRLSRLDDATHVFYAAFQPGSGPAADYARNIAANRDMLIGGESRANAA